MNRMRSSNFKIALAIFLVALFFGQFTPSTTQERGAKSGLIIKYRYKKRGMLRKIMELVQKILKC